MPHDSPTPHSHDDLPPARKLLRAGGWSGAYDCVVLDYEARFLRRKRLVTVHDEGFLVDLPETVSLEARDAFQLDDGRLVEVLPAEEPVLVVQGDLARLAWHIGNRHTPCQIEADRLLIRQDHVLEAMLRQLGAEVSLAREPFTPQGGAYGLGRTMGHDHGPGPGHHTGHLHVHQHGSHSHVHDEEEDDGA
jgi:urease accessory protein